MNCPRCGGWIIDSPDDLADRCYNCGRLYYRFIPLDERPKRESKQVVRREYSPLPDAMFLIFEESGGTIHVKVLNEKMLTQYKTGARRVRDLLGRDVRFSPMGRGWYTLTSPSPM